MTTADGRRVRVDSSRRAQRNAETRRRILDAASRLFVENGFDTTTYDQIAAVAGVARQTVFNHYPKKEDFAVAWGESRRAHVARVLIENADCDSAVSRLILTLDALASFYEDDAETGRVFTIAWVKAGGPVLEEPVLAYQLADILADGQRGGEIQPDVDVHIAGQLLRAAYFDALWAWAAPTRTLGSASLFAAWLDRLELILVGLCPADGAANVRRALALARSLHATRASDKKQHSTA